MSDDTFGVEMAELAKIEQDWRTAAQQMDTLGRRLDAISTTLEKAVAIDLVSAPLASLPGFLSIAGNLTTDVKQIVQSTHTLQDEKKKLCQELGQDAEKLAKVRAEYEATEKKIQEKLKKINDGDGDKGGDSGGTGHSGGTGSSDPDGHSSSAAKIPVGSVTYGGAGSWKSGREACKEYIDEALDKRGITDPQARKNWEDGMLTIASRESSYNAPSSQVNEWDTNAHGEKMADGAAANCSRGGWQTIPGTFAAYHQPGTSTDIYDPVANVAASMNYISSRYGVSPDGSDLASKVHQADPNHAPQGY